MSGSMFHVAVKLALNGFRFHIQKRVGRPGKPQAVSLEITHHCIARCIMCNIWKIHDQVRNYRNAWEKVNETLHGLKGLQNRYANLIVGLKTTILPLNVASLKDIAAYADKKGLFTIISPCIITTARSTYGA